jgi:hypothetical protein
MTHALAQALGLGLADADDVEAPLVGRLATMAQILCVPTSSPTM